MTQKVSIVCLPDRPHGAIRSPRSPRQNLRRSQRVNPMAARIIRSAHWILILIIGAMALVQELSERKGAHMEQIWTYIIIPALIALVVGLLVREITRLRRLRSSVMCPYCHGRGVIGGRRARCPVCHGERVVPAEGGETQR